LSDGISFEPFVLFSSLSQDCIDPPPETGQTRCAIVVSSTHTTAASLSSTMTTSELRAIVAEELKYAFTGNRLEEFLATL
jgi:hypothetical protein